MHKDYHFPPEGEALSQFVILAKPGEAERSPC